MDHRLVVAKCDCESGAAVTRLPVSNLQPIIIVRSTSACPTIKSFVLIEVGLVKATLLAGRRRVVHHSRCDPQRHLKAIRDRVRSVMVEKERTQLVAMEPPAISRIPGSGALRGAPA